MRSSLAIHASKIGRRQIDLTRRDLERLAGIALLADREFDLLRARRRRAPSPAAAPRGAARGMPTTATQPHPSWTTSARCPSDST